MFNLKSILFGGAAGNLPEDVAHALAAWREQPGHPQGEAHFHTRYVVVEVVASGTPAETATLRGIVAVGLSRGGVLIPDDVFAVDFADAENPAVDRQWMAFLQFLGKSPLVVYHAPFAAELLKRCCKRRLGVDLELPCIDLAWLLPSMFEEKAHSIQPLDFWLDAFAMADEGRRDAMNNALLLARLFQRLLVRASERHVDTAGRLADESQASSFLRRTH